jgi:hypothetical protein
VLVVVNLPLIVIQVIVLMSSVLMNETEVYASRMLLLLAPVSASALRRCSSWLTVGEYTIQLTETDEAKGQHKFHLKVVAII